MPPPGRPGAWNAARAKRFFDLFEDFLEHVEIDSKETGVGAIELYNSQRRFLDSLRDGLTRDIHDFTILKARQLGMSTVSQALDLFWCFIHPGTQGALIFDTDANKEAARDTVTRILDKLPKSHAIKIKKHNKDALIFENGSRLAYLVAGTKRSAGSGGLGRSRGLNFVHATEMSSWGDEEGLAALRRSLAKGHPNRLYIWESTARGPNLFQDMWEDAVRDDLGRCAIFIGWWAKFYGDGTGEAREGEYRLHPDSPEFRRYGALPPNEDEAKIIDEVATLYGHKITMQQLAWLRYEQDPTRAPSEDDDGDIVDDRKGSEYLQQELPSTASQAFLITGSLFFDPGALMDARRTAKGGRGYKGYRFRLTENFDDYEIFQVFTRDQAQLKVWEEPVEGAVYVMGADPAFGHSDRSDYYAIEVLRCYSDGLDQVAEFRMKRMATFQFAWVIAHLGGWYRDCRYILELNGPGEAVQNELKNLPMRLQLMRGRDESDRKGIHRSINHIRLFETFKPYLYRRADTLSGGPSAVHWMTSTRLKSVVMNQLNDAFIGKALKLWSVDLLDEMKGVTQDGDSIEAPGAKKDDRVMALALAVRAWNDFERKRMLGSGRTRELETKRASLTHEEMNVMFQRSMFTSYMAERAALRQRAARAARGSWRVRR